MNINLVLEELEPLRNELKNHKLYKSLKSVDDIKIFMKYHVFAVWDFMSLLKELQNKLCKVSSPWFPSNNNNAIRFINEIILEEESDFDEDGNIKSHFEMYLDSMIQTGASISEFDEFSKKLIAENDIFSAISTLKEDRLKKFLNFTFSTILTNKAHKIASAFTFGREDIIPDMFIKILDDIDADNIIYNKFRYYLNRHIELDSDHHGPLSLQLITTLCGDDSVKWQETIETAIESLKSRIQLWDLIHNKISISKKTEDFQLTC